MELFSIRIQRTFQLVSTLIAKNIANHRIKAYIFPEFSKNLISKSLD